MPKPSLEALAERLERLEKIIHNHGLDGWPGPFAADNQTIKYGGDQPRAHISE